MTADRPAPRHAERILRFVLNAFPSIAFVAVYVVSGAMQAALDALVLASLTALVVGFAIERKVMPLPLITGVLGLATALVAVIFHSAYVLKLKLTIVHVLIGLTLLGLVAMRRNPFGGMLALTETGWRRLMFRYALLSLAIAVANLIVWRTQSDAVWVAFHFPGVLLLNIAFLLTQLPWLRQDLARARSADP